MNEMLTSLSYLLSDVVLPNLQAVQSSQNEQIAANDRLEQSIENLRTQLESQFGQLMNQITACRAEVAACRAALEAMSMMQSSSHGDSTRLIH
jgi:hypothetical protein